MFAAAPAAIGELVSAVRALVGEDELRAAVLALIDQAWQRYLTAMDVLYEFYYPRDLATYSSEGARLYDVMAVRAGYDLVQGLIQARRRHSKGD